MHSYVVLLVCMLRMLCQLFQVFCKPTQDCASLLAVFGPDHHLSPLYSRKLLASDGLTNSITLHIIQFFRQYRPPLAFYLLLCPSKLRHSKPDFPTMSIDSILHI